jgi:hypothetical protein
MCRFICRRGAKEGQKEGPWLDGPIWRDWDRTCLDKDVWTGAEGGKARRTMDRSDALVYMKSD